MQIGLLGKTNVGKSTFFSAATETPVNIGNFPFTTIKPNVGIAYVKAQCACKHFGISHENQFCIDGTRIIPIKLVDVAGLVPGAHKGKGLGNQFLDDSRQANALIHVVDISGSTDITGQPVTVGSHDPLEDVSFVEDEFDQWFTDILQRDWQKITKEVEQRKIKLVDGISKRFSGLGIKDYDVSSVLQDLNLSSKNPKDWENSEIDMFTRKLRRKSKPMLIAANKADLCKDLEILEKIKKNNPAVFCSAESELLLRKANKAGLISYVPGDEGFTLVESGKINSQQKKALELVKILLSKIKSTGIQSALNFAVFELLKFIVVFPVEDETKLTNKDGNILPDAKLVPQGSTAKELAAIIHEDLGKGFLHAIDVKTKKRIGAEHVLQNGDVIKIVSSMSRG